MVPPSAQHYIRSTSVTPIPTLRSCRESCNRGRPVLACCGHGACRGHCARTKHMQMGGVPSWQKMIQRHSLEQTSTRDLVLGRGLGQIHRQSLLNTHTGTHRSGGAQARIARASSTLARNNSSKLFSGEKDSGATLLGATEPRAPAAVWQRHLKRTATTE